MASADEGRKIGVGSLVATKIRVRVTGRELPHPAGSTAWVRKTPDRLERRYRVQFGDGSVCDVEGELLRLVEELGTTDDEAIERLDLGAWVIHQCVVGSVAHGLAEENTEADVRSVYLPPADLHWSFGGVPDRLDDQEGHEITWELQHFLALATRSSPEVLEVLYTPMIEYSSSLGEELIGNRHRFLSRQLLAPFCEQIDERLDRVKQQVRLGRGVDWQNAAELVRMQLAIIGAFEEGALRVDVGDDREALIAVQNGEMDWVHVDRWRVMLEKRLEGAYKATALRERIDLPWVDDFLVRARRSMV